MKRFNPNELKIRFYYFLNKTVGTDEWKGFIALLCFASGVPFLFSYFSAPSLEPIIPDYVQTLWGISLTIGAVCLFIGQKRGNWPLERAGLRLLGYAAAIYAIAMVAAYHYKPPVSLAFVLGFAVTCMRSLLKQNFTDTVEKEAGRDNGF